MFITLDLTFADRRKLSAHLDKICGATNRVFFEVLAEKIGYNDVEIFNFKLYQHGGGFPAFEFAMSLCIRKAEMKITEFINVLQKEHELNLSECFAFLKKLNCATLGDMTRDQKEGFARTISKWLRPNSGSNSYEIAEVMDYTKEDILAIGNTMNDLNAYSAGDKLLESIIVRHPDLTLIDLSNYLANIKHFDAKQTLDKSIDAKVQKLKEKKSKKQEEDN